MALILSLIEYIGYGIIVYNINNQILLCIVDGDLFVVIINEDNIIQAETESVYGLNIACLHGYKIMIFA